MNRWLRLARPSLSANHGLEIAIMPFDRDAAARAVVRVGEGRGFIVQADTTGERFILTAAHCLPRLPKPIAAPPKDRFYRSLIGRLDSTDLEISAECRFADYVFDIAVLVEPNVHCFPDEESAYDSFTGEVAPLHIDDVSEKKAPAWLLSLDGIWQECLVDLDDPRGKGLMFVSKAHAGLKGGMSGSPILDSRGKAIGVHTTATPQDDREHGTSGGPEARLSQHLPGWLLNELVSRQPGPRPALQ